MRFIVLTYKKASRTVQDFNREINEAIKSGEVKSAKLYENLYTGNIQLDLLVDDKSSSNQEITLFGLDNIDIIIDEMKIKVEDVLEGSTLKAVELLPLGGSRALGLLLISLPLKIGAQDGRDERKTHKRQPNKNPNVKSDNGTKA